MSMTPSPSISSADASDPSGARMRALMGGCYAVAAILTATSVGLGSSPSLIGPLGPASPVVLLLMGLGFLLIAALAAVLGWRLMRLLGERDRNAGARLHLRFVALFALAAVAPAVIVAFFFGVLVTRGVDNWFSARVQTVVENSATVARSYLEEGQKSISDRVARMAGALKPAAPILVKSPTDYSRYLSALTVDNGFSSAYLINRQGGVFARAEPAGIAQLVTPPAASFQAADEGDISLGEFESTDLYRALFRLPGYDGTYLYVVHPLSHGIFRHLHETSDSLAAYRQAKAGRARIKAAFYLSYLETVLLVLVGAVWFGMAAAARIAEPVARLVQAAGRVAAGDLTARVDSGRDPEEIAVLSRAFNRMTIDLQQQQKDLRAAHVEAESGRLFTEAVLLGVSAGVIGLDPRGRVSAVNRQADQLLALKPGASRAKNIAEVAPELADVAARAKDVEGEAEADVDVIRGGETRRLRAHASHGPEGVVLTFDDITGLVSAQRNAAWKDVARRIAHEIKNPLTPIQLSAERLKRKYRDEITSDLETFDRCTDTIIRQVGDIGRMVDEFSAFARMPAPRFASHDAAELVRQAVFAQRVADPRVAIEVHGDSAPIMLVCDGRIVGQALANVLKNAGEAIDARIAVTPAPPGRIDIHLALSEERVDVIIDDNGVGLPAQDRDRLTEPYVTTRIKGTGLGLAIVRRILEDHGGRLVLNDRPRGAEGPVEGARIVLSFPLGDPGRIGQDNTAQATQVHA